jgi:polyhydroxyalkanoate synthesis repressor PhaR
MTHRVILRVVMAYVIKRYANRKLYDMQSKRYLTLDEVAILIRAGEEIQVVDADTGGDLTGQVLSRIIADGSRREGGLVPQNLLVEWIQKPGEAVVGAVKSSVSAGQRTVEQFGSEISKLFGSVTGLEGKPTESAKRAAEGVARAIEERLRAVVAELKLATKDDIEALARRIAALEEAAHTEAKAPRTTSPKPRPATPRKSTATGRNKRGVDAHGKEEN